MVCKHFRLGGGLLERGGLIERGAQLIQKNIFFHSSIFRTHEKNDNFKFL